MVSTSKSTVLFLSNLSVRMNRIQLLTAREQMAKTEVHTESMTLQAVWGVNAFAS